MNIKELVAHIAAKEGLKKQVSVGNIREIVGIISDVFAADDKLKHLHTFCKLITNGHRRAKRKKK